MSSFLVIELSTENSRVSLFNDQEAANNAALLLAARKLPVMKLKFSADFVHPDFRRSIGKHESLHYKFRVDQIL